MIRSTLSLFFCLFVVCVSAQETAPVPAPVDPGKILTKENGFSADPKTLMRTYWLGELAEAKNRWQQRYDSLKTVPEIEQYQAERKEYFFKQLGQMWEKTPLNPKIIKTIEKGEQGKDAYRIELVLFESLPNFQVSGAMFLPDPTRFQAPYPTMLIVSGHAPEAKAYIPYQQAAALAATNGIAVLSIDPIDQGERTQRLDAEGKPLAVGVAAHNIIGTNSIPLGRNAATFEIWDMIRALDYLESRPDVDPKRIGVAGQSGGGTQTSYIMSLDDRVAVAVPNCYLCGLYGKLMSIQGPQDSEQNIFGQLGFGMDHVDYCIMRAPKPTMIGTVTKDFFPVEDAWSVYRNAKRIYDRFGFSERMSLAEHDDVHGWQKNLREAAVRWMLRWLAGRDEAIVESETMPICTLEELRCTPQGEVILLEGARSVYDWNRDYNEELLARRTAKQTNRTADELRAAVRRIVGVRQVADIPLLDYEEKGEMTLPPECKAIQSAKKYLLRGEAGKIPLPAVLFESNADSEEAVVYLNESGKTADLLRINELVAEGKHVVAVDLRGLGETQGVGANYYSHSLFGTDGVDYYFGYLLGKSYVGMRTEDLLAVVRLLQQVSSERPLEVVASGETVGVVALHAGVLEPSLISKVRLDKPVRSWYDYVKVGCSPYPITNLVHGALLEYDIPDLQRQVELGQ